jgi:hypothetical protein
MSCDWQVAHTSIPNALLVRIAEVVRSVHCCSRFYTDVRAYTEREIEREREREREIASGSAVLNDKICATRHTNTEDYWHSPRLLAQFPIID